MTSEIRDVDALREAGKDKWQKKKQNTKDYGEPGSSRQWFTACIECANILLAKASFMDEPTVKQ